MGAGKIRIGRYHFERFIGLNSIISDAMVSSHDIKERITKGNKCYIIEVRRSV